MKKKPNIIFYFSDQQRWDTVNHDVTPHLMELASDGVKYESSFTCQPVCGPARACLQTGVYATQCGCYWNGIPLPEDQKPLAEYFNEAGYDTAYIGKWHLASDRVAGKGIHCEKGPVPKDRQGGYRYWRAADVLEFTSHGYGGYVFDEEGNRIDFDGYRVDCINDFALEYLEHRPEDKPFFLFVSQLEPHHQNDHHAFEGPKEMVHDYQDYPIPEDLSFLKGDYKKSYPDYMAAIHRLDENVGKLVARLKELGLYEDTIILYTSDHGCHFKTRNSEYKRSCHESSTHTPLIIRGGAFRGGKIEHRLVSLLDLPPTLLGMAGIPIPETYQGMDLFQQIGHPETKRECVFIQISESQVGRAIRTDRYKYAVMAGGQGTGQIKHGAKTYREAYLYDLEHDPVERVNLIKSPNYKETRRQLRELLLEQMKLAGEPPAKIRPALFTRKK